MSPQHPPQGFVDNFIRLLPDSDINDFQKVLEMKVSVIVSFKYVSDIYKVLGINVSFVLSKFSEVDKFTF